MGGAASLGEQQYSYQNLYVTGLIKEYGVLVSNIEDAIDTIRTWLKLTDSEYTYKQDYETEYNIWTKENMV